VCTNLRRRLHSFLASVALCGLLTIAPGCGDSESEPAAASGGGGGGAAAAAGVDASGGDLAAAGAAAGGSNVPTAPPDGLSSDAGSAAAASSGQSGPPGGMPMGPPAGAGGASAGASMGMLGGSMPGGMLGGGMPGGMPGMPGGGVPGSAPSAPAAPARPTDVSKWTDKQLREAVVARDRRVLQVIEKRVKAKPGDATVADLLMGLLAAANEKPAAPPAQAPGSAPGYGAPAEPTGDGSGVSSEPGAAGYGSAPGAPGYGTPPGAPGYGSAPGAPGLSGLPNGSSDPGAAPPLPGKPGGRGVPSGPPTSEPPPQSSLSPAPLDSISLMLIEYATAWQSSPAAGAMRGRLGSPGGSTGLLDAGAAAGQAPGGSQTTLGGTATLDSGLGSAPGGAGPGMLPGGLPGMSPGGMPGMGPGGMPGGAPAAPSVATMTDRELLKGIAGGLLANNSAEAWQGLLEIVNGTVKSPLTPEETVEVVVLALCNHQQVDPDQSRQVLLAMLTNPERFPITTQSASLRTLAGVAAQIVGKQTGLTSAAAPATQGAGGQFPGGMSGAPGMMGGPGMLPGGLAGAGGGLPGPPGLPGLPGAPGGGGGGLPGPPSLPAMPGAPGGAGGGLPAPPGLPGIPGGPGGLAGPPGFGGGESSGGLGAPGFGGAGFGAAGMVAAAPLERLPDAVLTLTAEFFFTPLFAQAVVTRLDQISDLSSSESLLRLAGSLPLQPVREALFQALEKHHSGGADALNAAGVFPDGMADPGALVVLKSLPRQRPPRTDDDDKPAPLDSWSAATQLLVQNYVSKLGSMSQGGGRMTANPKGFPVRAHRGGEFEYTGLLKLAPAANAAAGTGISETRIYYARTSFAPTKERERKDALEHYRSMGGAIQRADTARGTMWMDGVKAGGSGMRRTVDVLIRNGGSAGGMGGIGGAPGGLGEAGGLSGPPGLPGLPGGGGPGGGGGAGQNYTIEIVMVEIADPRGGSAPSDSPAASAN